MGRLIALLAFPLVLLVAGCMSSTADPVTSPQGPPAKEGRGLLPPPETPPGGVLGGVPPQHAFERDAAGAFSRTVFSANSARLAVSARDVSVPAHRQTQAYRLPGAVLVQVNAGTGTATVGRGETDLSSGRVFTVSAGTPLSFSNTGDQELALRLYVMEGQP